MTVIGRFDNATRAPRGRSGAGARRVGRGLRGPRERFESAFNSAPIGMAPIPMDGRWLQADDALCRITGDSGEELRATTLRAITHPEDVDLDAERRPLHAVTQVQDISERKGLARRPEYVVAHDFLTGLLNRRAFEQELARETERAARYGDPGAILPIDLDNFEDFNHTFGHRAGNDVLKGVAGLQREHLRQTDIVARVGGDAFAVLLTCTDAEQVQIVADEVVKALARETAVLADQSIHVTASVGVAMFEGLTDVEVLASADLDMYEAKETGRNRFEMYRPPGRGRQRLSARFAEAERIRLALEQHRMVLHCQPILDLATGGVGQYELLLRLPGDDRDEPLPPSAFLYRAERSGLIQAIDAWVVRHAIGLIAAHAHAGRRIVLNVNLSGRSVGDRELAAAIEDGLAQSGVDPVQLVLELTETAAISNVEEAKSFALRLHAGAAGSRSTTSDRASDRSTTSRASHSTTSRSTATSSARSQPAA